MHPAFFCAAWGCDTYWKPSSSWDYITVHRYNPPSTKIIRPLLKCYKKYCNPLLIQFTAAGKQHPWDKTLTWGLRLYHYGYDKGFTFSIKLIQENSFFHPLDIDSSPFLFQKPSLPKPPPKKFPSPSSHPLTEKPTATTENVTFFQPTLPAKPVSTAELILQMINASAQALSLTSYERCWLCYSPAPPFYEGIATLGTPFYTNNSDFLRWGAQSQKHGLTVAQVVEYGLCLLGLT